MTIIFAVFFFASGALAQKDVLKHSKHGPLLLTDQIVQQVYPDERRPFRHNGITVTDYFKELEVQYREVKPGCFRPEFKKWTVDSKIYVRAKSVMGVNGKPTQNPRWLDLKDHSCRESDKDFNTWDGTLYHEGQHFFARDTLLKDFWKELKGALGDHCSGSAKEAESFLTSVMGTFIQEVHKADSEDRAEGLEAKWYLEKAKQGCRTPLDFVAKVLLGAKVIQTDQLIKVIFKNQEFIGLKQGSLLLLSSKATQASYYFQFGSLLAHEYLEEGSPVRLEYHVNGKLKQKVWLDNKSQVIAKAWADNTGKLGQKIVWSESVTPKQEGILVSILDTGFEETDRDGHGTFVASIVQRASGADLSAMESIKVSSNLDDTLWDGLKKAQGKVINLSIGQGVNSAHPPKQEAIDKTCALIKEISKSKLIVMGAGNDGSQQEKAPFYPASCVWDQNHNVLVVGAWDPLNEINADFGRTTSNWSQALVDVLVTGGLYEGRYPGGVREIKGGTSFSSAWVSGLAVKMLKADPSLTPALLRAQLLKGCKNTVSAKDLVKGGCVLK